MRLDGSRAHGDALRLTWSFLDPEVTGLGRGRIRWTDEVLARSGDPEEVARSWWGEVQLEAARRYVLQIDADWTPGMPYVPRTWTVERAWQALVDHLAAYGDVVSAPGEVRVRRGGEESVYRIDPREWAEFLNAVDAQEPSSEGEIVPAGVPQVEGLPQWAVDDLDETMGAHGPVVRLVDGRLVGFGSADE